MSETIVNIDINNLQESYTFDKVAKQASGAVWYRQGKAVLLATVAIDEKPVEEDFLPMTVQYIEKSYAAAKIPGGFIKRETKPGDFETLTSRIIDRSIRPLFPKGFRYPIAISVTVLSSDSEVDMQVAALHAASAALFVSDTPVSQALGAVRLAKIDGETVVNPTLSQQKSSTLDLFVVGSGEDILMIEMKSSATEVIDDVMGTGISEMPIVLEHHECNELTEEELLLAIAEAQKSINSMSQECSAKFAPYAREPLSLELADEYVDEELYKYIESNYKEAVEKAIQSMAKSERSSELKKVRTLIMADKEAKGESLDKDLVSSVLDSYKRTVVRALILDKNIRADGRALNEVRPISIETNISYHQYMDHAYLPEVKHKH